MFFCSFWEENNRLSVVGFLVKSLFFGGVLSFVGVKQMCAFVCVGLVFGVCYLRV